MPFNLVLFHGRNLNQTTIIPLKVGPRQIAKFSPGLSRPLKENKTTIYLNA